MLKAIDIQRLIGRWSPACMGGKKFFPEEPHRETMSCKKAQNAVRKRDRHSITKKFREYAQLLEVDKIPQLCQRADFEDELNVSASFGRC